MIEKYDTALQQALATIREKEANCRRAHHDHHKSFQIVFRERDDVAEREKTLIKEFEDKCKALSDELKSSQARAKRLEREKAILEKEKATLEKEKATASSKH